MRAILPISQHVVSMVELERSLAAEGGPVVTPEGAEPESVDDEFEFGLDMLIAGPESLARRRGAA